MSVGPAREDWGAQATVTRREKERELTAQAGGRPALRPVAGGTAVCRQDAQTCRPENHPSEVQRANVLQLEEKEGGQSSWT